MLINDKTKLSAIIKENSASIDAIAKLAKPLEKIRNPILRRVMAPRVTLAEAMQIGGCTISDLIRVLQPLGFEYESKKVVNIQNDTLPTRPSWLCNLTEDSIIRFDVRQIIQNGEDPLKEILKRFKELETNTALCIINIFEPIPLVHLLKKKGIKSYVDKIKENEYYTYFLKESNVDENKGDDINKIKSVDNEEFQQIVQLYQDNVVTIDVRHLEMPLPMQHILQALDRMDKDHVLYVYHKKIPVYLLEQLNDMDYLVYILEIAEGNVQLLIHKKDA